jgi:membrane protein required for beta-lactamase induction
MTPSRSAEAGVDRFLGVLEKLLGGFSKLRFALVGALDHRAQRFQHHRQVGLELLDGFAKLGDLGTLVVEEEI